MWRIWRAKAQLLAPIWFGRANTFLSRKLQFLQLAEIAQSGAPELPPYHNLAKYYHQYAHPKQADYAAFLRAMAPRQGIGLGSILDLACGSGTATAALADVAEEVVGLDISEPMLAEARRRCSLQRNVRFVAGDFREFDLGRQFDAVVCATNSLNYVGGLSELVQVFRCVKAHLRPGGTFAFDTATEKYMRLLSGSYVHINAGDIRLAIRFNYDAKSRREESLVIMPEGTEAHRRIPLDPKDIFAAAGEAGLAVRDYFSTATLPGRWYVGAMCFFVLGKSES